MACADCHTSERNPTGKLTEPIAGFERCETCHADVHAGQFLDRADRGACTSCHDLEGFRPSRYTLEDHQVSSYPLEGSHLAIPCFSCHSEMKRFRIAAAACTDCHQDPHDGSLHAYLEPDVRDARGCVSCHDLSLDWRPSGFDHNRDAAYKLEGAHLEVPCASCHPTVISGERAWVRYRPLPTACADCHKGGFS